MEVKDGNSEEKDSVRDVPERLQRQISRNLS
jgi:hypothetical protein